MISTFARLAVAASLLAASTAAAAPARPASRAASGPAPYTLEDGLTLRSFSALTWSNDGGKLAFVVTTQDTAENTTNPDLYLMDFARDQAPRRLTNHPRADGSPSFSPSGDTLAFISTRAMGDDAKPAIYFMSLRGGDPWPAPGKYAEGIGEVQWSPDGRFLAYTMADTLAKNVKEWRKKKWDHVIEDERLQSPQVWVLDLASGQQRQLTTGSHGLWYVRWSPDSRTLAFILSPTGKPDDGNSQDIGLVSVNGGAMRTLGVIGAAFDWSPDGRWIALATGSDRKAWIAKADLWVAPAAGGKAINLTADFDEDAEDPAWGPNSDSLYFHSAQGVSTRLAAVARMGGPVVLGRDLESEAFAPTIASNGRTAWVQSQPTRPNEVWLSDRPGAPGRAITALNADVSKRVLGATRAFHWTSSDGVRCEGVLLRPAGDAKGGAVKTLVLLHGGPYTSRYALAFQAGAQWYASHGYQVFMPNFRSSGGYGTAFMMRERADWGGQDWRDVTTGVDALVKEGLADPQRLGVFGHSYGAYLSAWGITQTKRFDAAGVDAGAVDLGAHYGQSDVHRYRAFDFEGPPWETPENWRRASPITFVANIATPTLILVGEADARVPMPQSQQFYTALRTRDVPCEFVHYPREPHTFREYRHRYDVATRLLGWFDRWVK